MKELGESTGNENEAFKNIVHPICKAFPGEQLISGLTSIRDSIVSKICNYLLLHYCLCNNDSVYLNSKI